MLHDVGGADAESADGPRRVLEGGHDEVDVVQLQTGVLGDALPVVAKSAETDGLVDEEAQLKLVLQNHHLQTELIFIGMIVTIRQDRIVIHNKRMSQ